MVIFAGRFRLEEVDCFCWRENEGMVKFRCCWISIGDGKDGVFYGLMFSEILYFLDVYFFFDFYSLLIEFLIRVIFYFFFRFRFW